MQEKIYIADIYLRLSKEDDDREESYSIANQRAMLLEFVKSKHHNVRISLVVR